MWLNHLTVEDAGIGLGRCVFCSRALDCVATIRGWPLFEGGHYLRVATIRGWPLFEGGHYSRAATICRRPLFEGGIYLEKHGRFMHT